MQDLILKMFFKNYLRHRSNSLTAFIGPSGCGKTTLIRCLNRMHEMTPGAYAKGEIFLDKKTFMIKKSIH
jgi:ABC-type phosphate transport system ATPase subunit